MGLVSFRDPRESFTFPLGETSQEEGTVFEPVLLLVCLFLDLGLASALTSETFLFLSHPVHIWFSFFFQYSSLHGLRTTPANGANQEKSLPVISVNQSWVTVVLYVEVHVHVYACVWRSEIKIP